MQEAQAAYAYSALQKPGKMRRLHSDRYLHAGSTKAVVLLSGFVENGYWYQIRVPGYALADTLARQGFDVHVLSFLPQGRAARSRDLMMDASFREVVTEHLPAYHATLCERYDTLHYVAHSYGAALASCFLLGYRPAAERAGATTFKSDPSLCRAAQHKVQSFVSLAGFFGLDGASLYASLPPRMQAAVSFSSQELVLQLLRLIAELYKRRLAGILPYIPTHGLKTLRFVPGVQQLLGLTQVFSPAFFPFVAMANTHLPAFHNALAYGSSPETWETLLTLLGTVELDSSARHLPRSRALEHLPEHMESLKLASLFVQGDLDLVTTPGTIMRQAYERVAAPRKELDTFTGYGHQDLLTAKDPSLLEGRLQAWLHSF